MDETEDANYISAKQNGRHLVDKNEFIYSLIRKRNDKAYYACINKKQQPEPCQSAEAAGFEAACLQLCQHVDQDVDGLRGRFLQQLNSFWFPK